MKFQVLFRASGTILFLSGLTAVGRPLFPPIEDLRNWANPDGPGYQSVFLTHNGTRMMAIWEGGTLVVPMEESLARQYDLQVLYRPATVNPIAQLAAETALVVVNSGGGGGTPGAGGSSGGSGTGSTGGGGGGTHSGGAPTPDPQAADDVPEPGSAILVLGGLAVALLRRHASATSRKRHN